MKKHVKNTKDKPEKDINHRRNSYHKDNPNILNNPNQREAFSIYDEAQEIEFNSLNERENLIFCKPCEILPEWPGEEELRVFSINMLLSFILYFY